MVVAVLALQGAFLEHEQMLKKLGAEVFDVQQPDGIDAVWLVKAVEGNEDTGLFSSQFIGEVPERNAVFQQERSGEMLFFFHSA